MVRRTVLIFTVLILASCAGSKISTVGMLSSPAHEVRSIAMAPSGGLLADAIAVELFNRGYTVIDSNETTGLLVRLNLTEAEVLAPTNLRKLEAEGIDVYLSARAAAGYDGQPQSASIRVSSTRSGKIIAGVSWQNGWGGRAGSIADRTMRKDLAEAAVEITDALVKQLRR